MTREKSPQGAAGNLRDVRDPEGLKGAFSTLSRCFMAPAGPRDAGLPDEVAERRRLWRAIRVLREADAPMLRLVAVASLAGTDRLLVELVADGILAVIGDEECPRYRVVRDPGAALPIDEAAHA